MLISHRKKFIYTKTVKTGGTSVEVYFEPYCLPEGEWVFAHGRDAHVGPTGIVGCRGTKREGNLWFNHMSARRIRNQIGEDVWTRYFKFCVIRDPFDKLVSAFHFFTQRDQKDGAAEPPSANSQLKKRFREWLGSGRIDYDGEKYRIDGKVCVDYFIRYEDMIGGIRHVCGELDIPFEPEKLMRLKSGLRPQIPLFEYYDAESIDMVSRVYEFELKHFGYAPPAASRAA